MLELIFQGFLEWTYGLILECWEYFSSVLFDLMSLDFAYLESHMPIIGTIRQIMLAVGWALLLGNLVFQAIRSMMSGAGFEADDPKLLFARTFVFAFLLVASPQICDICLDMTAVVIEMLKLPEAVTIRLPDENTFVGLSASWLLVIVCGLIVMFQSLRLLFEMAERYFILAVLTIMAPLAFGVGGSRSTSDIFSGWCRMYGSMCLMMVMNVVFVKMLLSVLSYYPSGLDVLPWLVLVLTVVKVAKKIDAIVTRIGLNPAITGDSLGRSLPGMLAYTVARTAVSHVAQTTGRAVAAAGKDGAQPKGGSRPATAGRHYGGTHTVNTFSDGRQAETSSSVQQAASYTSTDRGSASVQNAPRTPSYAPDSAGNVNVVSRSSHMQAGARTHTAVSQQSRVSSETRYSRNSGSRPAPTSGSSDRHSAIPQEKRVAPAAPAAGQRTGVRPDTAEMRRSSHRTQGDTERRTRPAGTTAVSRSFLSKQPHVTGGTAPKTDKSSKRTSRAEGRDHAGA